MIHFFLINFQNQRLWYILNEWQTITKGIKMQLELLKGKIHRARLTACDVDYEGSLEIDIDYLNAAGILPYEKILVVNATNGNRLETYAIPGPAGSGTFCLNGAAARKVAVGDLVIIVSYALMDFEEAKSFKPSVIFPDSATNRLVK